MNIKIYYDGVNVKDNCGDDVEGFTTNISFLKAAGISDYDAFIKESLTYSKGRPISFQLFADTNEDIEFMANKISSYDESIFVKVPVIKTNEESNSRIIQKLHNQGLKINVTAIFTKEQIDSISECFGHTTDAIVSVFAGRINDCGMDSTSIVRHAHEVFKDYPNVRVLWAACRTVYNMVEAERQGADIVTVPDSVLKRRHRLGDDIYQASVNAVRQFRDDGLQGKIAFK